jgi:hypothetical protein
VHQVERADRASHIAQSRLGSAVLKGAGPMLPTDGRCARLSIGEPLPSCGYLPARADAAPANSKQLRKSQSILHHASKGASRAESIEQLTEESDRNSQQWIWPIAGGLGSPVERKKGDGRPVYRCQSASQSFQYGPRVVPNRAQA